MAKVESTEIYTQEVVADLDVVNIYKELMKASTSQGSVYLHAKETLVALYTDISMTSKDKATVIGQTISNIATGITGQAMQAAIAIAKENREGAYVLTKLKADTLLVQEQTDKIAADNAHTVAQTEHLVVEKKMSIYAGWKAQAELYRDFGVATYNLSTVTEIVGVANYLDYGLKKETINQVSKNSVILEKEANLKVTALWKDQGELLWDYGIHTDGMALTTNILPALSYAEYGTKFETVKKAKADTYNTYASSYRTNGAVALTLVGDGALSSVTTGTSTGLTYWQTKVAERQLQGFDDNMRQHVVNSSAAMISMLLSTDASVSTIEYKGMWETAANYLNGYSTYTWIKYADNAIGTGMSDSPIGKLYVGIAAGKTTPVESTVATDYTWTLI